MPILLELRKQNNKQFTIFSGENLIADVENGLNGECDFIITQDTGSYELNPPLLQIIEAKKNDVESGIAQCAAQLLGAKIYNDTFFPENIIIKALTYEIGNLKDKVSKQEVHEVRNELKVTTR